MPPPDEKIFPAPPCVATELELSARRENDVSPIELTAPRLLPFGSQRFWLIFPDDPHAIEGRTGADRINHRDRLQLLLFIKYLCGSRWTISCTEAKIRRSSGSRVLARVARASRFPEAGKGNSKRKPEWSGGPGRETPASYFCSTLDDDESTKALAWPYTSANFPFGVRDNRRPDWFEQPMDDAVRLLRRGTVSLGAW